MTAYLKGPRALMNECLTMKNHMVTLRYFMSPRMRKDNHGWSMHPTFHWRWHPMNPDDIDEACVGGKCPYQGRLNLHED